ncbi:hypothetical protein BSL82_05705 [Tardibacter chloracetimidivorans]|uniref:Uncharacterized protein n=1 Tax=Tardibacter chloracetimidivorans TaxID=1921510 RepID=A0A1L3ZTC0_9SPHN|nr:hypothetical protein [Tardibacter chloracetimidivorans]API58868.1 hypothetical protein BSL82_05705 [Tardibacter chloracetimidivorans]
MKLKDALAVLPVEIDWTDALAEGDSIQTASWAVAPAEDGGLVVDSHEKTDTVATAVISGGIEGVMYRLTNTVVTALGYADSRSISVRIGATRAEVS